MGSSTQAIDRTSRDVDAAATAIANARDAIGAWIRSAPIQQTAGTGRGGIAGTLDAGGRPAFLYGEITGYWLRWASIYAPSHESMAAAVEFLRDQWSGNAAPPTRVGAVSDWRNGAIFSFDLAMMLRGLADAAPVVGERVCAAAAAGIVCRLDRMIDVDGLLLSHVALDGAELPSRWSTRPGPFQAKTAAAILHAGRWLDPALKHAARRTLDRWRDREMEHEDLHPRFYAIEGRAADGGAIDAAQVLAERQAGGALPERADTPGSRPRGDIQAQALRLLCLADAPDDARDGIAFALLRHVQTDGSVRCHLGEASPNIWCAMFAHQALDWLCARRGLAAAAMPDAASII